MNDKDLEKIVERLLPRERIEALAKTYGVVQRRRIIDVVPLVWGIVLATLASPNQSFADWHRFLLGVTRWRLNSRSAFYDRLTPALTRLFKDLLLSALKAHRRSSRPSHWLEPALPGEISEILAIDSSVVHLRDALASTWTACIQARSALKLHAVVNVLDFQIHRVQLSSQTRHDLFGVSRVKSWIKGRLLLFDLAYYAFDGFKDIHEQGGYFLSRMKSNTNPKIIEDLHAGAGSLARIEGKKLKAVAKRVKRQVLDVRVRLSNGLECRAVGIRDTEEEGAWRWYLTNLPASYPAQEIGEIYRLRWTVELVFKALKSGQHMDVQTSVKKHRVELKMWATLLGYVLTGRLCETFRSGSTLETSLSRGLRVMAALGTELAISMCRPLVRSPRSFAQIFDALLPDPNRFRSRSFDPLLRFADISKF